jgi:hypothetical protein
MRTGSLNSRPETSLLSHHLTITATGSILVSVDVRSCPHVSGQPVELFHAFARLGVQFPRRRSLAGDCPKQTTGLIGQLSALAHVQAMQCGTPGESFAKVRTLVYGKTDR